MSNKIDNGAAAPARRTPGPVRRERGPFLSDTTSLVRALGPIDATMIVIGSMIGSGIFIVSAREDMPHVGYPIVPIISIVLSALLTIDLAWLAPATSGIAILIVLTGVPAYFLWRLRAARHASPVSLGARIIYVCQQNQRNNKWQPELPLPRSVAKSRSRR